MYKFEMNQRLVLGISLIVFSVQYGIAADLSDWRSWRGPQGHGSIDQGNYPVTFAADKYLWRTPLPGKGCSTPIVLNGMIYVTAPVDRRDALLCYDTNGKEQWQAIFSQENAEVASPSDDGGFCASVARLRNARRLAQAGHDVRVWNRTREEATPLAEYGATPGRASFANNCLLARRLVEAGVRFVQLFDWGWDVHGTGPGDDLVNQLPAKLRQVDRPLAALVLDLKRRGLLDDTLVIRGGEFGRTPMVETNPALGRSLGRDHHPQAFTMWLAGGGVKPGITHGATDDLGFHVAEAPVHVHDLQATILHLLGFDHEKLTYRSQGRDFRLTDVHGLVGVRDDPATEHHHVVRTLLAQQLDHLGEQGHVRPGVDRQPDRLSVLLQCRRDDLLRRLVQAGVDHLHAGVAERRGDDLGAPVVAVEAGLGDQHPDPLFH